jgi:hypothetical protein
MTQAIDTPVTKPLTWAGLAMIITPALLHAAVGYDPFPDWSADPTVVFAPKTTLGPAEVLSLNLVVLIGVGFLAVSGAARASWMSTLAALAGGLVAVMHNATPEAVAIGGTWASAMLALVALHAASRDSQVRTAIAASLLGCCFLLVGKGAYQVLVEHPRTLESFRAGKAQFLAAQGWSEGSIMAKAFERRLVQSEASGWFGLSNVYATVCAGMLAAFTALSVAGIRKRIGARALAPLIAAAAASGAGVLLAGGKGGVAAAALGVVLAISASLRKPEAFWRRRSFGPALALGCVLGALVAIVARGVIGERISELSLLFRWFYMQGAARIFVQHPLTGVGPGGFKDAYILYKPPISPEEVTSPHSVFLDYTSTLGVAGILWSALVLARIAGAGRTLATDPTSSGVITPDARPIVRFVGVTSALAMLGAVYIERPVTTPEALGIRVIGVLLATTLAGAIATAPAGGLAIGTAACVIAMFAHGQIEVSPVWIGSAPILLALLGAASAPAGTQTPGRASPLLAIAALVVLIPLGIAARSVWSWQSDLHRGATMVGEASELRERLERVGAGSPLFDGDTAPAIAKDLAVRTGGPAPASIADLRRAIAMMTAHRALAAASLLEDAAVSLSGARLSSPETERTARRLWGLVAQIQKSSPGLEKSLGVDAIAKLRLLAAAPVRAGATAGELAAEANFRRGSGQLLGDPGLIRSALELFGQAAAGDPYGLLYALEAYRTAQLLGDRPAMAAWAATCLERDALTRLDPVRGLTDEQRREMKAISS